MRRPDSGVAPDLGRRKAALHAERPALGQVEREVMGAEEDRQFLARVLPYRSIDDFIAGVVVTFLEITGTTRAEAALREKEAQL